MECKHGLPIKPEVSVPERIREHVANLLALKVLLGSHKQLSKRKRRLFIKIELLVCVSVFAALLGSSAERVVWIMLVEPVVLIKYRDTRCFDRWNVSKHIPHALKVVVHLSATAHVETLAYIFAAVTASACKLKFL